MAIDTQGSIQETNWFAEELKTVSHNERKWQLAAQILAKHAYGDKWEEFLKLAFIEASEQ